MCPIRLQVRGRGINNKNDEGDERTCMRSTPTGGTSRTSDSDGWLVQAPRAPGGSCCLNDGKLMMTDPIG